MRRLTRVSPLLFIFAVASLLAQQFGVPGAKVLAQASPAQSRPPVGSGRAARPKEPPCWEVAGIPQTVMERHRSIQEGMRAQVQAVCRDTSLGEPQKLEKIREIRQAANEESNALVSPEQREKLKQCQMARQHGGGPHPGGVRPPHPSDPCAGL